MIFQLPIFKNYNYPSLNSKFKMLQCTRVTCTKCYFFCFFVSFFSFCFIFIYFFFTFLKNIFMHVVYIYLFILNNIFFISFFDKFSKISIVLACSTEHCLFFSFKQVEPWQQVIPLPPCQSCSLRCSPQSNRMAPLL